MPINWKSLFTFSRKQKTGAEPNIVITRISEEPEESVVAAVTAPITTLTIGDAHGNPMVILHKLCHAEPPLLNISPAQFEELNRIYRTLDREMLDAANPLKEVGKKAGVEAGVLSQERIAALVVRFHKIIAGATLGTLGTEASKTHLRLIGDIFHDRGANDLLMLSVLEKIKVLGMPLEILASNHDARLFDVLQHAAERGFEPENVTLLNRGTKAATVFAPEMHQKLFARTGDKAKQDYVSCLSQARSTIQMGVLLADPKAKQQLVDAGVIQPDLTVLKERFESLVSYNMKLLSYELIGEGARATIRLYTHAPVPFSIIKLLAEEFDVPYKDGSAKACAQTIDAINAAFRGSADSITRLAGAELVEGALHDLVWKRYNEWGEIAYVGAKGWLDTGAPQWAKGTWHLVHGHDGRGEVPLGLKERVTNLDSGIGYTGVSYEKRTNERGEQRWQLVVSRKPYSHKVGHNSQITVGVRLAASLENDVVEKDLARARARERDSAIDLGKKRFLKFADTATKDQYNRFQTLRDTFEAQIRSSGKELSPQEKEFVKSLRDANNYFNNDLFEVASRFDVHDYISYVQMGEVQRQVNQRLDRLMGEFEKLSSQKVSKSDVPGEKVFLDYCKDQETLKNQEALKNYEKFKTLYDQFVVQAEDSGRKLLPQEKELLYVLETFRLVFQSLFAVANSDYMVDKKGYVERNVLPKVNEMAVWFLEKSEAIKPKVAADQIGDPNAKAAAGQTLPDAMQTGGAGGGAGVAATVTPVDRPPTPTSET